MKSNKKIVGITLGDPCGIGSEVTAKALSNPAIQKLAHFLVIGDYAIYQNFADKKLSNVTFLDLNAFPKKKWELGKMTKEGGSAALIYLQEAVKLIKEGKIHSLVTAPVNKQAIALNEPGFQGHTEFLADSFGIKKVGMLFVGGQTRTIVVTRHIPLKDVSKALNVDNIYDTIKMTDKAFKTFFKIKEPRLAVCGLNPHAGEGGHIGTEEIDIIIPAVKKANKNKMRVEGPFPPDTIFTPNVAAKYDVIVSMYHDQGLIPLKTTHFAQLVNMTIGLPFVRTSPAHGTGFNIAKQKIADPTSMSEAIKIAAQLS